MICIHPTTPLKRKLLDEAPSPVARKEARFTLEKSTLGSDFLQARANAGLSQRELAEKSGISRSLISRIETGARSVYAGEAYQLAQAIYSNKVDKNLGLLYKTARLKLKLTQRNLGKRIGKDAWFVCDLEQGQVAKLMDVTLEDWHNNKVDGKAWLSYLKILNPVVGSLSDEEIRSTVAKGL
jgi:predicted transcriptional regulator